MAAGSSATVLAILVSQITLGFSTVDWSSIATPPKFVHPENENVIFYKVESKTADNRGTPSNLLEQTIYCIAEGNPEPEYRWLKNKKPLALHLMSDKIVQKPKEGTLVFSHLEESDAGEYQCLASNDNGTAVARSVHLAQTWMRSFPPQEPEVVRVELGDPFSRSCTPAGSNPNARMFWILKGVGQGQFDTINGSHISSNDQGTIFFHHVTEQDSKPDRLYTCTAENTKLKEYKFGPQFKLEISKDKRRSLTRLPPTEQYVNQSSPIALRGNQHKLHCFFSGFPTAHPTWYHNESRITDNNADGFKFESYGNTLVFNVAMDKAGKYECRFSMHHDTDRTFNVVVEAAPYWSEGPPLNTNTSEGETVTFDCTTSGKPVPVVTFYKNGVEMKTAKDDEKWVIDGNKLTIYDVKKGIHGKGDNAVYQCKAENKHGYVWTNFYLNLLAFKPQFISEVDEVEAVIGRSVALECKFFASPKAQIEWQSPLFRGEPTHNVIPSNALGVGKLVIISVSENSEGEYECFGSNKYGSANGIKRLVVRKPTRLEPFLRSEEVLIVGEEVKLPCKASGDENLGIKYEWLANGEPLPKVHLDSGHYKIDSDNSLIIANLSQYDTAKYKCIASTKLDQVAKEIQISIKDVPGPIHNAYIKCKPGSLSAEISFEHMEPADTVAPVKEFWVQYQMDSKTQDTQWQTHPVPVQTHPIELIQEERGALKTIIALQPYGQYKFRVFARNDVGDSAPTLAKDGCDTPATKPNRHPTMVAAAGSSRKYILISWKPMPREEWNGPKFHYKIRYRASDSNASFTELDVWNPLADKVTISLKDENNGKPLQQYEIQVLAVNDEGVSNAEPETVGGRIGDGVSASVPENFKVISKDGTSATFGWDSVDRKNGNFSGYKITYWHEEEDDTDHSENGSRLRWKRDSVAEKSRMNSRYMKT